MAVQGIGHCSSSGGFFKEYKQIFESGTASAALRKEIISTCMGVTAGLISGSLGAVCIEEQTPKKKGKNDAAASGPTERFPGQATKSSWKMEMFHH